MEKKRDTKFVEVSKETHERLGEVGAKNEKYGEIVKRLIDNLEESRMVISKKDAEIQRLKEEIAMM